MREVGPAAIAIVSGVIMLAIVAVIVSRNAQTPTVLTSAGSALASVIGAAVQPVSGSGLGGIFGNAGNYGSMIGA